MTMCRFLLRNTKVKASVNICPEELFLLLYFITYYLNFINLLNYQLFSTQIFIILLHTVIYLLHIEQFENFIMLYSFMYSLNIMNDQNVDESNEWLKFFEEINIAFQLNLPVNFFIFNVLFIFVYLHCLIILNAGRRDPYM